MKQILTDKSGRISVAEIVPPVAQRGRVVVRTAASLISAGTERLTVEQGQKSLVARAREQPDLVRKVFDKAKSEGLLSTFAAVKEKLGSSIALGYSAAGIVNSVGPDVTEFRVGQRVSCAGTDYASHAEVISVPQNLCVHLPNGVDFEAGAFGTLGAVALQGVRLAAPTLGESAVVIGLGLIGQLTLQLLRANGCRVFGLDIDPQKIEIAKSFGFEAAVSGDGIKEQIAAWTRGRGADAVLITAATPSNEPVTLAGEISRMKGRVIAVGLVGLDIPRNSYYRKELELKVSMSYGPGRYDPEYEERGHDYPFPFVRWTEGRNIEAFLDLVAAGTVQVDPLISHRFPIEQGEQAYRVITGEAEEPYLAVLLKYDTEREVATRVSRRTMSEKPANAAVRIGMIGAGDYAKAMLLPHFKAAGAQFEAIATAGGLTARDVAEKYGFGVCVADAAAVIVNPNVNLVMIATRHDSHSEFASQALAQGRDVFVEKPLALDEVQLQSIIDSAQSSSGRLMVGYNRRFAPLSRAAAEFFSGVGPLSIQYRINAGRVPSSHWTQDPLSGGGRIIGEVCHFIDFMHFLTGSLTTRVFAEAVWSNDRQLTNTDSVFITLRFANGSNGAIAYLAEGDKALAKEQIEIFGGSKTFVVDDFTQATSYEGGREKKIKHGPREKGQREQARVVCETVLKRGPAPIALDDLIKTSRATFAIRESLRTGLPVEL